MFLYALDLIALDGNGLRREPPARKATLALLLRRAAPGLRLNEHIDEDGPTVFAHACETGLEGIVSKRKASAYRSGPPRIGSRARTRARRQLNAKQKRIGVWRSDEAQLRLSTTKWTAELPV